MTTPTYHELQPLIEPEDRTIIAHLSYRIGTYGDPLVSFSLRRTYIEKHAQRETPWFHGGYILGIQRFLPLVAERLIAEQERLRRGG